MPQPVVCNYVPLCLFRECPTPLILVFRNFVHLESLALFARHTSVVDQVRGLRQGGTEIRIECFSVVRFRDKSLKAWNF